MKRQAANLAAEIRHQEERIAGMLRRFYPTCRQSRWIAPTAQRNSDRRGGWAGGEQRKAGYDGGEALNFGLRNQRLGRGRVTPSRSGGLKWESRENFTLPDINRTIHLFGATEPRAGRAGGSGRGRIERAPKTGRRSDGRVVRWAG